MKIEDALVLYNITLYKTTSLHERKLVEEARDVLNARRAELLAQTKAEEARTLTITDVQMYPDTYSRCPQSWLKIVFSSGEVRKTVHAPAEARALFDALVQSVKGEA